MLVDKPQVTYSKRKQEALKSNGVMTWISLLILIITAAFRSNQVLGAVIIIIALVYGISQYYTIVRVARMHLFSALETTNGVEISYQLKDTPTSLLISVDNALIKTIEKSRYTNRQLQILSDNKTILQQFAYGQWTESELETFEKELIRIGFKKA